MRGKDPDVIRSCKWKKKTCYIYKKNGHLSHITASLQAVRDIMKVVILDTTWTRSGLFFSVPLVKNQQ